MNSINLELPFYYMFESVTFDEDHYHEFKGHRSICAEEIHPKCIRSRPVNSTNVTYSSGQTRQAVSKALNGFLNTGDGGCVYLGITDDGIVRGIMLTDSQKDHIQLDLQDLMARYIPPVPPERYKIRFVPVISKDTNPKVYIEELEKKRCEREYEMQQHLVRTYELCWCDIEAGAKLAHNKIPATFVVEVRMLKYDVPPVKVENLHSDYIKYFYPIYETEEKVCYFRREASVNTYSAQEIYAMSTDEAETFCLNVIDKLKMEKKQLEEKN